jgi:transcriptional regulator with XRE-family HTH domain
MITAYLPLREASDSIPDMRTKSQRLSDQIRGAVNASGMSRYAICRMIALSQGSFSRFMSGQSGLSMETLDRLGELLDLEIMPPRKRSSRSTS